MVFATSHEAGCLKKESLSDSGWFLTGGHEISVLVTGVGCMATAWAMKKWLCAGEKPDIAINAGIAGSFHGSIPEGEVVMPVSDCFADLGIETDNGFIPLKNTMLMEADKFPFIDGNIPCNNEFACRASEILRPVKAITVNTATGTEATAEKLKKLYNPDIETMEGAAFFYICSFEKIPFIALRAVSNKVGTRSKNAWNIPLALSNLEIKIYEILKLL